MSFDEQPDASLHGECAAEIESLNTKLQVATTRIAELEADLKEQCHLLGMSSEREASLLGKIGRLEKLVDTVTEDLRVEIATRKIIAADNKEVHAKLARYENQPTVFWQWRRKSDQWALEKTFTSPCVATTDDSEVRELIAKPLEPQ